MCMKLRPVRLENIYVLRERERERKRERENTSRMDMLNLCRQEFPLREKAYFLKISL